MIRKKTALTSQKATGGMIKRFSSKYPPAEYSIGSEVIVRGFSSKSRKAAGRKKAGKTSRIISGTVLERNLDNGMYKVCYLLADHEVEEWFEVSNLTAVTLKEENKKHSCNEHAEIEKSARSSSSTPLQTCSSTEFQTTAPNPQGNRLVYSYCNIIIWSYNSYQPRN